MSAHSSWCTAAALGLLLLTMAGCYDPATGEIGMKITQGEEHCSCLVQVFTDKGRQIQEVQTDELGVLYVKKLPPGTYTFKFQGPEHMYNAVRTVTIGEGASAFLAVDVDQAKDPKGEAEASASAGHGAAGDGEHDEQP